MKVEKIKNLPNEFDFISSNNLFGFGIIYHAKENTHNYFVTWNLGNPAVEYNCTYSKEEFRRKLFNKEFRIIEESENQHKENKFEEEKDSLWQQEQ